MESKSKHFQIALFSDWPELLNPLWIMPKDVRSKARACEALQAEELLDLDPYLARLWYVTADKQSGKQKMGWIVNHHKRLKNPHFLWPQMLDELWVQVKLGFIPANRVGDIFERLDEKTIGQIAYELGLYKQNDVEEIIAQAIKVNPNAVADYQAGEKKALGAILGYARKQGVNDMRQAKETAERQLRGLE